MDASTMTTADDIEAMASHVLQMAENIIMFAHRYRLPDDVAADVLAQLKEGRNRLLDASCVLDKAMPLPAIEREEIGF
jgi:hypothetical protein